MPPRRRPRLLAIATLLALTAPLDPCGLSHPSADAQEGPTGAPTQAQPEPFPNTPEGSYKSFFVAMAIGDEPALRAVALPVEGFEWLLMGQRVPADQVAALRKAVLEQMVVRPLKVGESVRMPEGPTYEVKPDDVSDDRAMVIQDTAPLPIRCRKVDGRWKVDPTPIIAARKAAEAARQRSAQRKGRRPPEEPEAARSQGADGN